MGSDWDYINEHMGGHDEDGMANFMSEPGFSDDFDYIENYAEEDIEENEQDEIEMNKDKSSCIIENLIARIEIEGLSLGHITEIELKSLKFALSKLTAKVDVPVCQPPPLPVYQAPHQPVYQPQAPRKSTHVYTEPSMDFDDDIPF